jgi:hypothetical protein
MLFIWIFLFGFGSVPYVAFFFPSGNNATGNPEKLEGAAIFLLPKEKL